MLNFRDTGGLFENLEVNREPFWPRIMFLLATSVAWHALAITCIILIPPVRDALSIALVFSGGRIVDRPYKKMGIENEGDIVELTTEKFHYPEGYFAVDGQPMPSPTPQVPVSRIFTPKPIPASQLLSSSPTPTPVASPSPAIAAKATPTAT